LGIDLQEESNKSHSWKGWEQSGTLFMFIKYLFTPTRKADIETTDKFIELATIAMDVIIKELLDKNKATYKYLSISGTA